jgi:hypothetical protein
MPALLRDYRRCRPIVQSRRPWREFNELRELVHEPGDGTSAAAHASAGAAGPARFWLRLSKPPQKQ